MISGSFPAMGTTIEVWTTSRGGIEATAAWFEEVEQACSRFRPDSELSKLNSASGPSVAVDGILRDVLEQAQRLRSASAGLVDSGIGAALAAWGYDRSFEMVSGLSEEPAPQPRSDWRLDGTCLSRSPGVRIDLGGIAKGWACDRSVERGLAVVVSAGGDICSVDPETVVPIVDPWGQVAAKILLGVGGLATSSTTRRRWVAGAGEASHIFDPRTMRPVDSPVLSATVVAATAVEAEAGAKSVLLLGESGLAWADEADWVAGALVVWHDGSVYATRGLEWAA